MEQKYLEIRTSTLRPNAKLTFEVYISVAGKHLLYVKSGDELEKVKHEKLLQKNIHVLLIKEQDKPAYDKFLVQDTKAVLKDKNVPIQQKSSVVTGISKAAVQDVFQDPGKKENFVQAEQAASNQVDLLLQNPQALEQLLKVANLDKTVYQHSVNVATIAIGLSAVLGASEEICQVVGVGALLHDIGRSPEIPPNAVPENLSPELKEKLHQHPRLGAQMLMDKKYISKDVLDIILFHEERLDGTGFPGGIKKLDQIFQVVALANFYDKQITFFGKSSKEAFDFIRSMKPAPYDSDMIDSLKEVLIANNIY